MRERIVALIPAYDPGDQLLRIAHGLIASGVGRVVVVDDGSAPSHASVFGELDEACIVLRHEQNRGKGAALRTGFRHVLDHLIPNAGGVTGVVTVDADGQHASDDALRVADEVLRCSPVVVLGIRELREGVPLRSRVGNTLARGAFALATGRRIRDTQCGLRGFPMSLLPTLLDVKGDGYEYETNVLMRMVQEEIPTRYVSIRTIYEPENPSSHFRPLLDSMRIWAVFARFSLSGLAAAALDYAIYALLITLGRSVFASVVIARASSFFVNFTLNRRVVFRRGGPWSFVGYTLLVTANVLVSVRLIGVQIELGVSPYLAKVLSDTLLFFVNFVVQRAVIFGSNRKTVLQKRS